MHARVQSRGDRGLPRVEAGAKQMASRGAANRMVEKRRGLKYDLSRRKGLSGRENVVRDGDRESEVIYGLL